MQRQFFIRHRLVIQRIGLSFSVFIIASLINIISQWAVEGSPPRSAAMAMYALVFFITAIWILIISWKIWTGKLDAQLEEASKEFFRPRVVVDNTKSKE